MAGKSLHWGSPDPTSFQASVLSTPQTWRAGSHGRTSALWPLGFWAYLAFFELPISKLGPEEMGSAGDGSASAWGVIPLGGEVWQDLFLIRTRRW